MMKKYGDVWLYSENNLRDLNGRKISIGQRIRVYPSSEFDGVWEGNVSFEDGVYTVCVLDIECVRNPENWDKKHDWTKSRGFGCSIGYGEWGSWNCPREPLSSFAPIKNKNKWKRIASKFGYGKRYLNVKIIGQAKELNR